MRMPQLILLIEPNSDGKGNETVVEHVFPVKESVILPKFNLSVLPRFSLGKIFAIWKTLYIL